MLDFTVISSLQNNALASLDMTYSSLISYSALNRKTLQQQSVDSREGKAAAVQG